VLTRRAVVDALDRLEQWRPRLTAARTKIDEHLSGAVRVHGMERYGLDGRAAVRDLQPLAAGLRPAVNRMIADGRLDQAARLAVDACWFWDASNEEVFKLSILRDVVEVCALVDHPATGRVRAIRCVLRNNAAEVSASVPQAEVALAECEAVGDELGAAFARIALGIGRAWAGEIAEARALLEAARIGAERGIPALDLGPQLYLGATIGLGVDPDQGIAMLQAVAHLGAEIRGAWFEYHALTFIGTIQAATGRVAEAEQSYRLAVQRAEESGVTSIGIHGALGIADCLFARGELDEARERYTELALRFAAVGDHQCEASCLCSLADLSPPATATRMHQQALVKAWRGRDLSSAFRAAVALAAAVAAEGDETTAARMLGALRTPARMAGRPRRPADLARRDELEEKLRAVLGVDEVDRQGARGATLGWDWLVGRAYTEAAGGPRPAWPDLEPGPGA
jgi:hypothetical protein